MNGKKAKRLRREVFGDRATGARARSYTGSLAATLANVPDLNGNERLWKRRVSAQPIEADAIRQAYQRAKGRSPELTNSEPERLEEEA